MKLRHIFTLALAALLAVGCSDDNTVDPLGSITIDQTFVSIPEEGGDASVTIKAGGDWAFDKIFNVGKDADGNAIYAELPAWLTADKTSGSAGETLVTFHADATTAGREAELRITTGSDKQFLIVRQGSMEASEATCADVIAAPDGKTFRVTGTVAAILNTQYGNWDLQDETGTIRIYGTNDKDGKKGNNPIDGTAGWGFEVGDIVTVEGPKSTYGTTIELVDVNVISITKSLLKVVTPEQTFGIEGGDIDVKLAYKGSGAYAALPDDCDWITITGEDYIAGKATLFETNPADTAIVHLHVAPNTGAGRKATLNFSSSNAKSTSTIAWTVKQDAFTLPHGQTPDDPFTVEEALAFVSGLEAGKTTDEDYCIKGYICAIKYTFSAQYGTATFFISDDGSAESPQFQVYSCYYFDNQSWKDGDQQIQVGDEVIVKGKVVNYNGNTPETASKQAYIYSLKQAGPGSRLRPFNADEAIAFVSGLEAGKTTDDDYYIEGEIVNIKFSFSAEYGTATFFIATDDDPANDQFQIYSCYYLGNRPWADGDTQIQVGDQVVVCGKLVNYNGNTPETASKKAYIYTLNGKKE